ncbi:MAG: ankyrin repeat domain-containing protein [Acidobacteria bacterium]|nr:ankyrin repeat domain-containing protein [Acidobacteriota bacterium]
MSSGGDGMMRNARAMVGGFTALLLMTGAARSAAQIPGRQEVFVSLSGDTRAVEPDGTTPLHKAVRAGDREQVQALIQAGADVNARAHTPVRDNRCVGGGGAVAPQGGMTPAALRGARGRHRVDSRARGRGGGPRPRGSQRHLAAHLHAHQRARRCGGGAPREGREPEHGGLHRPGTALRGGRHAHARVPVQPAGPEADRPPHAARSHQDAPGPRRHVNQALTANIIAPKNFAKGPRARRSRPRTAAATGAASTTGRGRCCWR